MLNIPSRTKKTKQNSTLKEQKNCHNQAPMMSQLLQINTDFMSVHLGNQGKKEESGSPKVVFRHKHFIGSRLKEGFNMWFLMFRDIEGHNGSCPHTFLKKIYKNHGHCSAIKAAGLTLDVIQ